MCGLCVNLNPIRAGIAAAIEEAENTSAYARLEDSKSRDKQRPNSGYGAAVHMDGDGYDGVQAKRRATSVLPPLRAGGQKRPSQPRFSRVESVASPR